MDEPRRAVHDPDDERAACCWHRIQPTAGQDAGHSCHHGDYTPLGTRVHITRRAAPGVEKSPREDRHRGDRSGKILPSNGTDCHHDEQQLALDSFMILTTSITATNGHGSTTIAARLPLLTAWPSPCSTTDKNAHGFAFVAQHVPTLPDNGPTATVCRSTEHGPQVSGPMRQDHARPGIAARFQLEGIAARAPSMRTSHLLPVQSSTHITYRPTHERP